jgi:hypothetical protein
MTHREMDDPNPRPDGAPLRVDYIKRLERGPVTSEADIDGTRVQYHDTKELPHGENDDEASK